MAWVFIFELAVNFGRDDEAARRAKAVFANAELRDAVVISASGCRGGR